jgi:hypothetical protein
MNILLGGWTQTCITVLKQCMFDNTELKLPFFWIAVAGLLWILCVHTRLIQ